MNQPLSNPEPATAGEPAKAGQAFKAGQLAKAGLAASILLGCAVQLPAPSPASAQEINPRQMAADAEPELLAGEVSEEDTAGAIPSKNLLDIIKAGGILMVPIFLCSFILLVFVFERTIALRRGRVIPRPFVKRFMHQLREGQLNREQALALCEENKSAVAGVFAGAVRKWGRPAVEVEQAALDGGERAVNGLRRYVRVFNAVATVSPLLGLLGTVFGMIASFNEIATADAMGRPEQLAAGISEALITTAAGLTVAIPALTCYLFFISRVDQLIIQIDALGQELVELISAEGLQANQPKSRATRREAA